MKRVAKILPLEIQAAKKMGYNLGIKLIRGAYMNEERRIAKEQGYESPICDTIEDTHANYNNNLKFVIENLGPMDRILIGSHNLESVDLAKKTIIEKQLKDGRVRFA